MLTLQYHNLIDKFDSLFFKQSSENKNRINKYENAISILNLPVQSVIVFENEMQEIEDAVSAGISIDNIISL
jgi:hypothetical protein